MFEAVELGHKVSKADFDKKAPVLQVALLEAQRQIRESGIAVIILVSGVEGAGKGGVVNLLHKWLDTRGLETTAFWDETDEERERPRYWRFWRSLPPKGKIGIMFGSWYTKPIVDRALGHIDQDTFNSELHTIGRFERGLIDDGTLIIKLWFHLPRDEQEKRLAADAKREKKKQSPYVKKFSKHYDDFARASERAIRVTDAGYCPWHLIEATQDRHRDLTGGAIILQALENRLARHNDAKCGSDIPAAAPVAPDKPTILDCVDLSKSISKENYRSQLEKYQTRLTGLAWEAWRQKVNTIAVFEGWDAAGKGGAIGRVTQAMDARLYNVTSVAAPTDEERAHPYLWRFWRHIPRAGYVRIYDRSWYGRVLVERVEGFASPTEWGRAYQEINDFEEQLLGHRTVLLKFWVHIDKDEQQRRFEERQQTAWKLHKITDEDWRNRERWDAYEAAVSEMVTRTSTEYAPWTLVPGNDKRFARVFVVKAFCDGLKRALGS